MLSTNPPLAALHGARLDHSGAVARSLIDAAGHLVDSSLRMENRMLDGIARRVRAEPPLPTGMLAIEVAADPELLQLGAGVFQQQLHLAADLGTHWVALGEWHQHGFNALLSHWLARAEPALSAFPFGRGVSVLQSAVESADHAVSDAAALSVQTATLIEKEAGRSVTVAVADDRQQRAQPRQRRQRQ